MSRYLVSPRTSKVSAPITNKRVMSTFQSWFKTSELALKHAVGSCGGHQNYMCVEFGGAMESMDHEQKISRVKQVEGV
jgi:hypothetical protein